jgi:AbiEi antitoxin C-terminal domain
MVVRLPDLGPEPLPPFTRRDLPGLGLTRHELDALVRAGLVVQPVRGAYVDARCPDDLTTRARAAALVLPVDAALNRRTAAWLHGIDARGPGEQDQPLLLECVVPAGQGRPKRSGMRAREAALEDSDIITVNGVATTTPLRTAVDLLRFLPPFMGLAVMDALANRMLIDADEVAARIDDFAGGRGVKQARRLATFCDPGAESFGESWLRLRLLDAGFPRPECQIWMVDQHGVGVYRLDLGWPDRCLAVEYDGMEFHSRAEDAAHDVRRRERLADEWGWHVVGVGKGEVLGRSLNLEQGVGELLGLEPQIRVRTW